MKPPSVSAEKAEATPGRVGLTLPFFGRELLVPQIPLNQDGDVILDEAPYPAGLACAAEGSGQDAACMMAYAAQLFIDNTEVRFTSCECGSQILTLIDDRGGMSAWHYGGELNFHELRLVILRHMGAIASIERTN